MVPKKRDRTNIALAIIILNYIFFVVWFKIIFYFDSGEVGLLGLLIFAGIVAGCIAYYKGGLHNATPELAKKTERVSTSNFRLSYRSTSTPNSGENSVPVNLSAP